MAALAPSASFLGVVAAALAAALWLAADLLDVAEGRQAAVVGSIAAIVLAAVGWRVFGRVLPFLALLALAIPTGEFLLLPLRRVTVAILEAFAAVSGLPFAKDGFTVHFGANRYVVVDACGGLPFVLIGLFLGLTFALLLYRNPARIAALALAGVVAGIVANGIRVVVIVTVDLIRGTQLDLVGHGYLQWGSLVATMILMMALFALLRPEKTPAPAIETPNLRRRRSTGPRARVAASALIATALAASAPYLVEDGAWSARAAVGAVVPAELAGWRRQDRDTDWSPAARRATSATLASYRGPLGVIDVYVATAAARRDKVTGGGVDLIGGDAWMPALRDPRAWPRRGGVRGRATARPRLGAGSGDAGDSAPAGHRERRAPRLAAGRGRGPDAGPGRQLRRRASGRIVRSDIGGSMSFHRLFNVADPVGVFLFRAVRLLLREGDLMPSRERPASPGSTAPYPRHRGVPSASQVLLWQPW